MHERQVVLVRCAIVKYHQKSGKRQPVQVALEYAWDVTKLDELRLWQGMVGEPWQFLTAVAGSGEIL